MPFISTSLTVSLVPQVEMDSFHFYSFTIPQTTNLFTSFLLFISIEFCLFCLPHDSGKIFSCWYFLGCERKENENLTNKWYTNNNRLRNKLFHPFELKSCWYFHLQTLFLSFLQITLHTKQKWICKQQGDEENFLFPSRKKVFINDFLIFLLEVLFRENF